MKASDVMTVGATVVTPDTTLKNAANLMVEHRVSGLPVVEGNGRLVGIVTEGDLLRRVGLGTQRKRPRWIEIWLDAGELAREYVHDHSRRIGDVMTREVTTVTPDTPLRDVVDLMEKKRFKRLPVTHEGRVVGIISRANLLVALSRRMSDAPSEIVEADMKIRQKLMDDLRGRDWTPLGTLDIVVTDGIVYLNGTVDSEDVRKAVRVAAERTLGVKSVQDNMKIVRLPAAYI